MKPVSIAMVVTISVVLAGLLAFPTGARAHEFETSVDWDVAYANIQMIGAPVYTHYTTQTLPLSGPSFAYSGDPGSAGAYATIPSGGDTALRTGDYLTVAWSFRYVAGGVVRGDLFWITRLGLDFATIGRYVTCTGQPTCPAGQQWIGGRSFELIPNARYDAELVLRSIQPNFRHLHVGVSVQNVGNIPAAPTVSGSPPNPILYGVFTDANGPVVEPLAGTTITGSPFGSGPFILLQTWPWAVGGFVAQVLIGLAFIGIMFWYGRWEQKKGARA